MTIVLITCSGLSNVGRLTTAVGQQLLMRRPGCFEWVRAQAGPDTIADTARGTDLAIVIDGCEDCCGSKRAAEAGVEVTVRLMATQLGIVKDGRADVRYVELETVAKAIFAAIEAV